MRLHLRCVILFGCCLTFITMLIGVKIMKKGSRRVWAKHLREEGVVINTNFASKDSIAKGITRNVEVLPSIKEEATTMIKLTPENTKVIQSATEWTTTPETPYNVPVSECGKNLTGKLSIDKGLAELTYWKLSGAANSAPALDTKNLGMYSTFSLSDSTPDTIEPTKTGNCKYQRVALIIPFRDREHHLKILLGHLLPILQRQKIRYTVFVAEQSGNKTYNKGRLMNTAFEFAAAYGRNLGLEFDCYVFHDVDMLVEHDTTLYRCTAGQTVDHFGTTIDKYRYRRMCCALTVGGVVAFEEREFRMVNGYPNSYWGWGGEDDDMDLRLKHHKISITRPAAPLGRYSMIKHERDVGNPVNPQRKRHLSLAKNRFKSDGLSSLKINILELQKYPLFIKVLIDVEPVR